MKKPWKTVSAEIVHQNPWWRIKKIETVSPEGQEGEYFILEKKPGVITIPKLENETYLMIKTYRYPLGEYSVEFPAGSKEASQQDLLETAKTELVEETGYQGRKWTSLGTFAADPGHSSHRGEVFLAEDLVQGDPSCEADEIMENLKFSSDEIDKMVINGEIVDSWTIVAWAKYRLNKEK